MLIREGASPLRLCWDGTFFLIDFWLGFDTPETHISHVQNLILRRNGICKL